MSKVRFSASEWLSRIRRGASIAAPIPIGTLTHRTHSQPDVLGEDAAEEHAGRATGSRDGAPDAERLVALGSVLEGRGDDGERGRREQRGAEALDRPGGDQRALGLGEAAGQGGGGENEEANDEDLPAAKKVGEAAAKQQEAAECEDVCVDDPGEAVLVELKVSADRRERHVHDRGVEDDDELSHAEERQRSPPLVQILALVRHALLLRRLSAYNRNWSSGSENYHSGTVVPFATSLYIPMTIPVQALPRVQRADARRNREAVIEAARSSMATDGLDAQMDDIAREAGVGVGTVYRHFPNKEDLIYALTERRFERLAELAREALAEDDPGPAFERYLFRGAELQAIDRALNEVMRDRPDAMQAAAQKVGVLELAREVMTRAQDAGHIRADAEAEDIPMLMCGLGTSTPGSGGPFVSATSWQRFLAVILDGLRAPGTSEMPPR